MTRFAVNVSILFKELPLLERPAAAAAGFDAVELWWPFDEPAPADAELDALATAIRDAGVSLTGLNFDAGDMAAGERGLLSRPAQNDRFRANIPVAIGLASALDCLVMNALYGNREDRVDPAEQDELALENLTLTATAARSPGSPWWSRCSTRPKARAIRSLRRRRRSGSSTGLISPMWPFSPTSTTWRKWAKTCSR